MRITVIGSGYVGLVSGSCFANVGNNVICVDIDSNKIDKLKEGIIPIYEPGLSEIVKRNYTEGRLTFTTNLGDALKDSEIVFIAVGTPPGEDGAADLRYVLSVAKEIGEKMTDYIVVVTKSTVPIGTGAKVKETILKVQQLKGVEIEFSIASNPEFLKEGAAVEDFLKPDRIIIGTEDKRAAELMKRLYKPFQLNSERIIYMDIPSAEMTKYAANSMLATKISFMNDMANLCERVGADVNMVRRGIGSDPRIGNKFIYPGIGYGGSCFPKDVKAIINTAQQLDCELKVLQAVEEVNNKQKYVLVEKIKKHFGENLKGKTFAIWGLSFKPNTDDIREAPSLVIIKELCKSGAELKVFDPVAMDNARNFYINEDVIYSNSIYEACLDADAILLLTEWSEFRMPNWEIIVKLMKSKIIFDGRNIYDGSYLRNMGFTYYGIGLPT